MPSRRQVLTAISSAGIASLAGCTHDELAFEPGTDAETDWPMPRFDTENTAYSPTAAAPRAAARERWTFDGPSASGPPTVVDGTVFLPTAEALVALDTTTGEEQWRFAPSTHPWPSGAVVHDGLVYVNMIDEDGLYAVDAASGDEVWSLDDTGYVHAAPHLIAGEHVSTPVLYAGTEDGSIRRIDPQSGETTWQTDLFGAISTFGYWFSTLYVGTRGGDVYAFHDSVDGVDEPTEGWRRKVGSAVEAILPQENCILVKTFGGPLRCLQDGAHAGTTRWSVDARWANTAPINATYSLVSAGYDGMAALRDFDRQFQWRVDGRYDTVDPVAAGDTLYVSSGESVHAFALDGGTGIRTVRFGAKRWSHPTPAAATEGLAVADGALFAACQGTSESETTLYCLEPAA